MGKKLTQNEINKKLSRLNNLEMMYDNQVKANVRLKQENKKMKEEIKELKAENKDLRDKVEKLELMVEELRTMIFKKTSKPKKKPTALEKKNVEKKKRDAGSYQRATPEEKDITDTVYYNVESCNSCGGELENIEEITRYVEDMHLPKNGFTPLKKVTKEIIQKGYCVDCKKNTFGKTITGQHCTIGLGIKAFVVYGITALMLSYEQIQMFMESMVNTSLSDGEIVYILKKESVKLRPEYTAMMERIRSAVVVHLDETGRGVQSLDGKQYAWVMSDIEGIERVYILGTSRGGGNLDTLIGDSNPIGVSDDYSVYRNAFEIHQLCWAHPIRKLRDLTQSKKLNRLKIDICKIAYKGCKDIHKKILNMIERGDVTDEEKESIYKAFDDVCIHVEGEPEKLANIRKSFARNKEKYFVCLHHKGVPTTNNTAERVLRPLVIKRKLSYGSKTTNGTRMMEVIYSVVFSLLAKSRYNFFDRYLAL